MKTKILIVKLGYSETLDPEIGRIPSLGDVLRTTPMLWALKEKYPDSHITWLVSEQAEPLLIGNRFIDRLLVWDEFVPFQLMKEKFDMLINLEKIAGVCALSDMVDAWVKYGFRFDSVNGTYQAYEKGIVFLEYLKQKKISNKPKDFWQKVLIEMLGVEWREQEYVIGYKPKTEEKYDIGLNYRAGEKWPTKIMPMSYWKELEKRLVAEGYTISWQEGPSDLYQYMDWMNSCRAIISHDSLGIHMAIAFKKKTIGLFGSTDPQEIYHYGNTKIIHSGRKCDYMPCYSPKCLSGQHCMEHVELDQIIKAMRSFYAGPEDGSKRDKEISYKART